METEKIIETLKLLEDTTMRVYEIYKRDGEPENACKAFGGSIAYFNARRMLENPDFAAQMRGIYFKEEAPNVDVP